MYRSFIILAVLFVGALARNEKYNGAKVFSITPHTVSDVSVFQLMEQNLGYDIWKYPSVLGRAADVMIYPDQMTPFLNLMEILNMDFKVKIEDVGKLIETSFTYYSDSISPASIDWNDYYRYADISNWMDELEATYPDLVRVYTIGQTWEGRDVKMLKISTDLDGTKNTIVSEAAMHAREWIAPAVVTYIINELVTNSANYADTLEVIDFVFVPVTNIDGYEYSWDVERLWRKTRQPDASGECYGIDGNRNFGVAWAETGSSDRPCSDTYHGEEPFSSPEVANIRDLILGLQETNNAVAYLAWHSAADLILRPIGYAFNAESPDEDKLQPLCQDGVAALEAVNGYEFECWLAGNLYPAGGASDDWAYEGAGVTYTYTPELRDNGSGFVLPPEQIIPSGEESFAFFQVIFEEMANLANGKK